MTHRLNLTHHHFDKKKNFLECSYAHLFMYCPWLLLCYDRGVEQCDKEHVTCKTICKRKTSFLLQNEFAYPHVIGRKCVCLGECGHLEGKHMSFRCAGGREGGRAKAKAGAVSRSQTRALALSRAEGRRWGSGLLPP